MFTTGASGGGIAVKDHDGSVIPELLFGGDHAQAYADAVAAALTQLEPAEEGVTIQKFTASGTFTWPLGVTTATAYGWSGGGGAGASASGEGGGAGGYWGRVTFTKTQATVAITVGAAVAVNTAGNLTSVVQGAVTHMSLPGGGKGSARTGGSGAGIVTFNGTNSASNAGGSGGTSTGGGADGGGGGGAAGSSGGVGGDGGANTPAGGGFGGVGGTSAGGDYPGGDGGAGGTDGTEGGDETGVIGNIPGGGGGGGSAGGTGAGGQRGEVWIEYYQPSSLNLMGCGV